MWRVVALLGLGLGGSLRGVDLTGQDGCRRVPVGRHQLYACVRGDSGPTVILEAGMRETSATWDRVVPVLTDFARVVTYDRAGTGQSDPGPSPRSSERIAQELHALTTALDLPAPFIVVGHSIGGWHALAFAAFFPTETSGVVLLDTPHPEFEARRMELLSPAERTERLRSLIESRRTLPAAIQDEYRGLEVTRAAWPDGLPKVRIAFVSAGRHDWVPQSTAAAQDSVWHELQRTWAVAAANGSLRFAEELGHNLHREDPELVARTIRSVLEASVP